VPYILHSAPGGQFLKISSSKQPASSCEPFSTSMSTTLEPVLGSLFFSGVSKVASCIAANDKLNDQVVECSPISDVGFRELLFFT
jgi:hypothetical protein